MIQLPKTPAKIRCSAMLADEDILNSTPFIEGGLSTSEICALAVHFFLEEEKDYGQMGRLVVEFSQDAKSESDMTNVKIYLVKTEAELVARLCKVLPVRFSQVIRYAYHRLIEEKNKGEIKIGEREFK